MNGAWVFLLLCNLLWSGNIIFGKYVIGELTPVWITFLRWSIAILVLFPITQWLERPNWSELFKRHWLQFILMGLFGGILFNSLTYLAIEHTSPTNVALISALNPAFIMIFSVIFLGERIAASQVIGLALSFFGVVFILTGGEPSQLLKTHYNLGDVVMLLVDVCWAVYSTLGKKLSSVSPLTATTISSALAVIMLLPLVLSNPVDLEKVTPFTWTAVCYIGIFATVCAFVLWNTSVRILGASKSSITMNLVPVYTAVITVFLGGELKASQIVGGIIVFAGMVLTTNMSRLKKIDLKRGNALVFRTKNNLNNRVG